MKTLSIVIPTIDGREASLARTIRAYEETAPGAQIVIERGHTTVAGAWNAGAQRCAGDVLHLTADDLTPEPGWAHVAMETIDHGALPAPIVIHPNDGQRFPPPGHVHEPGLHDWSAVPATVIPTLPASLWREIAPIREIHYFSDNMIATRAWRRGWISRVRSGYRFSHWLEHVGREGTMRLWAEHEAIFRDECAVFGGCSPLKVLITGGSGFIGSHLRGELIAHGHRVASVDMVDGDLSDPEVIQRHIGRESPGVVVHLAASPGRVFGEESAIRTIGQNAAVAANIARACAAAGCRLVYVSTSEIYGIRGGGMNYEGEPDGYNAIPHNLYGLSKRWGEEVSALYAPAGLQVIRVSMPYGPGLPSGRGRNAMHNFFWWAAHNERIRVHRGARRAWCWIGDTVRGIRTVIERGEQAMRADDIRRGVGVYNVGRDDNEVEMDHVARLACRLVGADPSLIDIVEPGPIVSPVKRLLCSKLWTMGWRPTVELEEGMAQTALAAATFPAVWT